MNAADAINRDLEAHAPAIHRSLSPLGRRAVYPRGIPVQAVEARGTDYNATIGQITDGASRPLPLPSMAAVYQLADADRDRVFLYSPIDGVAELRQLWRERQRRHAVADQPSTTPLVTAGLTHSLSIIADLFVPEGRVVATAAPIWGNYRQCFGMRTGADLRTAPGVVDGRFDPRASVDAIGELAPGEPAVVLFNAPSNPGGYSPTVDERAALVDALIAEAERRPLIVVVDDAYAGLVYEDVPAESLFWELIGRHDNLVPIKVDGVTKELSFFGGRVGFLTFAHQPDSPVAKAVESKIKSLIRSTIGSPVSASQMAVLAALRSPDLDAENEAVRGELEHRYRVLGTALAATDRDLLRPMPCNSGCFTVVEVVPDIDCETLRRHLIDNHSTGLVALPPKHMRIAFCSVAADAIPELVERLQTGVRELASA
ncbi:MAG: aminotransferase class I/II-fold pyridoxal phosphate-dependent enzyme [Acidobacteriota bacterium]